MMLPNHARFSEYANMCLTLALHNVNLLNSCSIGPKLARSGPESGRRRIVRTGGRRQAGPARSDFSRGPDARQRRTRERPLPPAPFGQNRPTGCERAPGREARLRAYALTSPRPAAPYGEVGQAPARRPFRTPGPRLSRAFSSRNCPPPGRSGTGTPPLAGRAGGRARGTRAASRPTRSCT